jgi:membrane-associated phospholipid phosphatase
MTAGRYDLQGSANFPQVEPAAAFWLRSPVPRAISLEEVRRELDHRVPDFDVSGSTAAMRDLARVKNLSDFNNSHDPGFFRTNEQLSSFLQDRQFVVDGRGMSRVPPGAVVNRRNPIYQPFLKYGAELARLFENETPGLWHRQVLNVLLDPTIPGGFGQRLSPPRQALIWAALDVAISSALQAAWYFKWFELSGSRISFRERPKEADKSVDVLYDFNVAYNAQGDIIRGTPRNDPQPTPGTPRHPAYPSGHSTYSAAASTVLGCLFPDYRASFNRLANNIGRARLWAGVHWVQDHTTGQLIGSTVGQLVIRQLNESGIRPTATPEVRVPDDARLRAIEADFYNAWRSRKDFCEGIGRLALEAALTDRKTVEAPEPLMNPGPLIEGEGVENDLPPGDDSGELDVETLEVTR